jgi:hypothetical protein
MRAVRMAQPEILVEAAWLLYLKPRRLTGPEPSGRHMELSPAADRLAGDLLIKAFVDESAKRS